MARVLVIEDDAATCELLLDILREVGFEGRCESDGASGLLAVRFWRPHVILLDLAIPTINGRAVLHLLPHYSETARVIVLTGDRTTPASALAGAAVLLSKPFDLDVLVGCIQAQAAAAVAAEARLA